MAKNDYSDSMSRSDSSSPVNSDVSIDINDYDEEVSQSPKREVVSSPVHQNGSVNSSKPSKLSFSISRLLSANSSSNNDSLNACDNEPRSSECLPTDQSLRSPNNAYPPPISPDTKYHSPANSMSINPYKSALNHLTSNPYQWFGSTPTTIIRDGLQSKIISHLNSI